MGIVLLVDMKGKFVHGKKVWVYYKRKGKIEIRGQYANKRNIFHVKIELME